MEKIVYVKSLDAKLTLTREDMMTSYAEILNTALVRDGVDVAKSFFKVRITAGKNRLAIVKAFKKNLVVYFGAESLKYRKYDLTDMSQSKSYKNYPGKMIIETRKDLKNATELLDKLMVKAGCEAEHEADLFTEAQLPVKDFNELVECGLIKKYVRHYEDVMESSDVAEAVEEAKREMVPVTFSVKVKGYGSDELYLFTNYHEWKLENALQMEKQDEHNFTLTCSFPKDYALEFKISLKKDWYGVEKGIFGEEIKNHSYIVSNEMTVEDIIYNFRNE